MAEDVKQRLRAAGFEGIKGRTAAGGVVAVNENPDDAAVENSGIGEALTWPCICQAQLGGP